MIRNILKLMANGQIPEAEGTALLKRVCRETGLPLPAGASVPETSATVPDRPCSSGGPGEEGIAVIGMAGMFPDAETVDEFWANLAGGRDSVRAVPRGRWGDTGAEPGADRERRGGFLSDIDKFDPLFFNISPKEAELMDPQQRLFLQAAWHAMEDAGITPEQLDGERCSVFVGYNFVDYSQRLMRQNLASEAYSYTGNASPILPARISYLLNLKGPGIAVNTACSSSMVAVHLACDSIRCGTSRLALAGGAQVMTTGQFHVLADSLGMSAKDGKCKTFDHRADGFVPGEAVGVVLLKSLSQARADGDPIHGIIIGSAVNQDGRTNGITAPSAPSQTALACEVYDRFGIHPETIGYVEAHGTGTELGDPIEVQALTDAFGRYTQKRGYCAIGAVKTNIGHTLAAAGVSSLIKTLLCLKYRKRVPSLHFEKPNPHIDFENSPFFVSTRLADWPASDHGTPRRAAVSSFGFSGTNVHVVLEEFIDDDTATGRRSPRDARKSGEPQLVVLSAKNDDRLRAYAGRLADFLDRSASGLASPACGLENIAYTLQTGRTAMPERLALVVSGPEELAQQLKRYRKGGSEIAGGYFGNTRQNREASAHLLSGETGRTYIQALMDSRDLAKIARLWVMGGDIDWSLLHRGTLPRRCPLPAYPFAKNRYWISDEVPDPPSARRPGDVSQPICFRSVWEEQPLERRRNVTDSGSSGPVLLFEEDEKLRSEYEALLKREVIRVTPGNAYALRKDGSYEIDPADAGHYTRLLTQLKDRGRTPGAWILSGYRSEAKTRKQQLDGLEGFDVVQGNSPVLAVFRFLKAVSAASLDTPLRILFLSRSRGQTVDPVAGAVFGYAKPLGFLLPGISFSTIHWLDSGSPVEAVCRELRASTPGRMEEIQYADGVRTVRTVRPLRPKPGTDPKVKNGGVYWITGGAGGLGRIFARYLARTYQARIVLTGRSAVTDAIQAEVDGLSSAGATVVYLQADAGDAAAMTGVMEQVKERFGRLDGVIHAAGVSTREVVFHKTERAFVSTLRPKIDGAIVLDRVTRDEPLQFFVLFSSIASVIGDFGQCDYAVGNRFLDRFAELREKARQSGIRSGRTLAVNWPIWRDGGMHQPSEEEAGYLQTSGLRYLETEEGLALFESLLDTDPAQVLVMAGDRDRIRRILAPGTDPAGTEPQKAPAREIDAGHPASLDPLAALEKDIARMAAKLLKLDLHEMDVEERFGNFGFDSLSLKKLGDRLGERFPIELSPAVFFANSSIRKLARFLIQTHEAEIRSAYAASAAAPAGPRGEGNPDGSPAAAGTRVAPEPRASAGAGDPSGRAVAIIGMHGMFPGSRDVNEFWEHLAAGRDLISEFPEERWNRRGDSDAVWTGSEPFPRWGGFLSDVDKFDPLFFKISPREAEMMDPQHRLFLETVWKTLEDAGYRPSSLSGKAVGVYAGIQFNDYEHLLLFSGQSNPQAATGTAAAMLANRISFLMNWHGPSESVVTACSSSLVAVHHAVTSLRNGESELAVAGGVSLILYPGQLIGAHRLGVLSPEGRCKTFDAGADGYVKGEGVGAVLLKPLEKALADGDHIHAVIRGTATNHGGTAASLTAPNSDAQAELLAAAFDDAGIDPESLTYMELHGTGTELGDPVEVEGVQKAFSLAAARRGRSPARRRSCGMGSVKTHIGHLEPAAGIAGLIKVVLCLQHRTLTGTLHLKKRNPYIRIEDSPLYIVKENRPWHPGMDERGNPIPRRAGVSSFGFGGTNAHVVVEEFEDPKSVGPPLAAGAGRGGSPQLFVLSAKSEERLRAYAGLFVETLRDVPVIPQHQGTEADGADLLGELSGICGNILGVAAGELDPDESFASMGMDPVGVSALSKAAGERYDIDVTAATLTEHATLRRAALHIGEKIRPRGPRPRPECPRRNPPIESIAYTLQTGREPMEFRLATVADDLDDLRDRWGRFAAGDDPGDRTFTGRVDTRKTASRTTPAMERDLARVEALRPGDWVEAAKLWTQGHEPDWRRLHQGQAVGRVPLPTYPFARERYWIPEKETRVPPGMSTRFFRPKWRKAEFPQGSPPPAISNRRIVFMDPDGIGPGPDRSMPGMEAVGKDALWIQFGPSFRFDGSVGCTIDPLRGDDYRRLLAEMKDPSGPMSIVLLRKPPPFHSGTGEVRSRIEALLHPVFYFCRSLMERSIGRDIRITCFSVVPPDQTDPLHTALGGFFRTLSLEHPGFHGKTVLLEDAEHLPAIMAREMAACESHEIRYRNGERCARELEPVRIEPASPTASPFKAGGVYLLAGGAGGLGFLFARHLAARAKAKLVLCGRSEPDREWMERIRQLKEMGSDAVYLQADLGRSEAVSALVADIRSRFGPINGVVHFAGVTRDAYILKKTSGEIAAVLAPKVFGTVHLDAATRGEPLDFFALFSSTAAIFGNAGQSDYAFANGFMDGFAQWRESVRKQSRRSGRTVSINWPLWKDGGMRLPEERSGRIFDATGLKPFPSEEGMAALERILLGWGGARCLAVFGDPDRITNFLHRSLFAKSDSGAAGSTRFPHTSGTSFPETLREKVLVYLTDVIARVLKLPARKIDASVNLDDYGIDSLLVNRFNDAVEGVLGPIPKTLLFEYQTLHDLTDYLVRTYPSRWSTLLEVSDGDAPPIRAVPPPSQGTSPAIASRPREEKTDAPRDGIAVIGMAGRYPQSPDVDTFWRNLRDGIDCISEVPEDRWDNRGFYDPDPDKAAEGKIYCKWGGFLEDAYRFDSQFFHIAPRDAELMDPQERIFLETAWHTMEDAGYNRSRWSRFKVGVFVGVTTHSYPLWGPDNWRNGIRNIPASLPWSIANRVSYVFDFQGPSMPVDTACSASLSAVHLACESLRNGECEMALAGGVNLYLHPAKYVQMCQSRMLSPKGRCSSFGADADGFVPGEGVGALLLKPLEMAMADGDRIYGVLRGSAVNHGGRTTGYTVPNPRAQATLIEAVLRKAGVDPRRISYVEGHGTGTELGDPVEIRGLVRAYARFTTDRQFCSIGSVKSNIGHLESAAGIAGLSKVLLQMKHRQLAPSLHCQVANPKINLDETPFFLQRELTAWEPAALDDGSADGPPARIATVSSFGAGGANAHVVVEEFQGFEASSAGEEEQRDGPSQLVPLSAKNEDRLRAYARRMAEFLQNPESPVADTASGIAQIAYTLQTGREAMDVRLAVIAGSVAELREKFLLFADSGTGGDGAYTGHVQEEREKSADLVRGESGRAFLDAILANRELDKIARLWVSGLAVDWDRLHPIPVPRRMSLPTYPFAPSRYRLPLETAETGPDESGTEERPRRIYFAETWQPSAIGPTAGRSRTLLLFETATDVGDALKQRWDGEVLSVRPGKGYEASEEGIYDVRPSAEADYRRLLRHLANRTGLPDTIVHFWSRTPAADAPLDFREQLDRILLSFFSLTKALLEQKPERRIRVLFFYPETEGEPQPLHSAMGAYAKTLQLENPLVVCKTVSMESKDASSAADLILAEMRTADDGEIRYRGNRRWRRHWAVFEPEGVEDSGPLLKKDGVYIVTGGAGGLGRIFTDRFTRKVKARYILAGRSAPTEELEERIRLWNRRGSEVVYHSADVTRPADVASLVQETRSRFGRIDGILHAAGTLRDGFLLKKNTDEVMAVIGPKVFGARMLDRATRNDPLDFFVMFSSTTGALGNEGQGDYAYANAYLDGFAAWRESRRKQGERSGRTLSIGWPLWRDGGMRAGSDRTAFIADRAGWVPLPTAEGEAAWEEVTRQSRHSHCVVGYGSAAKLLAAVTGDRRGPETRAEFPPPEDTARLTEKIEGLLKEVLSGILKLPKDQLDNRANIEEFGLDSIKVNQFNRILSERVGPLPKTLLFEHQTLSALTRYLVRSHGPVFAAALGVRKSPLPEGARAEDHSSGPWMRRRPPSAAPSIGSDPRTAHPDTEGIAVIGMHGRYPGAPSLDRFWSNLLQGKDSITEIPLDRWDYRDHFDPDPEMSRHGKIYCKWGGFLEDYDRFDPLFFQISPREAKRIDPQERLFLETAWLTFEDAGYPRNRLRHGRQEGESLRVGVYVGVTSHTYLLWGHETWEGEDSRIPLTLPWSVANRISYILDLNGPSMPVDTACSSSLYALHLACESLKKGECHMALAGGVNLYLHPAKFIQLCQARMLSPSGRCHTFGEKGDGFVPGEGVGAVLLKPLSKAVRDGDTVYAVIRGTAVNHGGKSTGYTVPSPNAQAALIRDALKKSGIDPETIGYVEAHGTGTELGDPVEIRGLSQAFAAFTDRRQFCAIGSLKSNVGHLESAAGIAGLTKIVLQMQHGILVPSLHSDPPNPNIVFEDTPFHVQRKPEEWKRPAAGESVLPRRAAISSFGAGGANAHVIVEEFGEYGENGRWSEAGGDGGLASALRDRRSTAPEEPQLIVLSARDEDRLRAYARRTAHFLQNSISPGPAGKKSFPGSENPSGVGVADVAYTLLTGREPLEERLAFVAESVEEVVDRFLGFAEAGAEAEEVFTGNIQSDKRRLEDLLGGTAGDEFVEKLLRQKQYRKLAQLWVMGVDLQRTLLQKDDSGPSAGRRIPLPGYPFARNRYWITGVRNPSAMPGAGQRRGIRYGLHPLLDRNTSTLREQRFSKELTGDEFFLAEHRIDGHPTLPAVCYLEMARAAGEAAWEQEIHRMTNVSWERPVRIADGPAELGIRLFPESDAVAFEITGSGTTGESIVHARGRMHRSDGSEAEGPPVDLDAMIRKIPVVRSREACYRSFQEAGLDYGPGFQAIETLYCSEREAVSRLSLPSCVRSDFRRYVLHPSILDGALQTVSGLMGRDGPPSAYLPFVAGEVIWKEPLPEQCFVHAVWKGTVGKDDRIVRLDITVLNDAGIPLAAVRDYSIKAAGNGREGIRDADALNCLRRLSEGKMTIADAKEKLRM